MSDPFIHPTVIPLDRTAQPDVCDCEFQPDPDCDDENTPETAWHYLRECAKCGNMWWSLHCPHDGAQGRCECGERARSFADGRGL